MKRAGYLIEYISDLTNLYGAYYKAAKGKLAKQDVIEYKKKLYPNLLTLKQQIESGNVDTGNYHYFTIYEPKERRICAASFPERILHHALINICHPYFENRQISDSYATRIKKGTYKAIAKAKYFSKHFRYYLKMDIRKYFDSISHTVLMKKLHTLFKDPVLLSVFQHIISSYYTNINTNEYENNSLISNNTTGLPIGNLTSQYFANFYLSDFDRFIKQTLQLKPYVRYMDDFVIWSDNSKELTKVLQKIENYLLEKLGLVLKEKYINTTKHGLNFLSYRLFSTHIELQQKSKKRFIRHFSFISLHLYKGKPYT